MSSLPIKVLNEERIKKIDQCIHTIRDGMLDDSAKQGGVEQYSGELILYHYTSIEKLFNILSGDSMWASRSRFSNDASEGEALGQQWAEQNQYYGDNFILCFCDRDDILSQWRGYCPDGGASIGFCFPPGYTTFTLLHANHKESDALQGTAIESYKNRPLPVIYCRPENAKMNATGVDTKEDIIKLFQDPIITNLGAGLQDIAPYLKNSFFEEERELRIVFDNADRALEDCIRFRTLEDGSMVPYIVVKYGDLLKMGRKLGPTYTNDKIDEIFSNDIDNLSRNTVIIPCGQDQASICDQLSKKIKIYKQGIYCSPEWEWWQRAPARIICEGHLPVVSITVSPSPRQAYLKEVIERFCRSRYWLQNVVVKCSEIPYVAPKL